MHALPYSVFPPAGVPGIEVLLAAIREAQALIDLVCRRVRSQGIQPDGLFFRMGVG